MIYRTRRMKDENLQCIKNIDVSEILKSEWKSAVAKLNRNKTERRDRMREIINEIYNSGDTPEV